MKIKFCFVAFLCLYFTGIIKAQKIQVSIFSQSAIQSFTITVREGKYTLSSDNEMLGEYKKGSILYLSRSESGIELRDSKAQIGFFNEILLSASSETDYVTIKTINPMLNARDYTGDFICKELDGKIRIVNKLEMEDYIAAVIEAESGNYASIEFYKAQAVLIRTYTIKNMFKHAEEGYNLCDHVHCQAYKGMSSQHLKILEAAKSTAGLVLIDNDSILAMSPFHSNCGGETSSGSMAWQSDLPYLCSVKDPFCTQSQQAVWSATISKNAWILYLSKNTLQGKPNAGSNYSYSLKHRQKTITLNNIEINLRSVRETFKLKSTFFSIIDDGTNITFKGRGYGHGVGMCQEGAMEMAKVGYTWLDIIYFYFRDLHLTDYREMELHRY